MAHKNAESRKLYNNFTKIVKNDISAHKNQKWLEFVDSLGKNPLSSVPFWKKSIK